MPPVIVLQTPPAAEPRKIVFPVVSVVSTASAVTRPEAVGYPEFAPNEVFPKGKFVGCGPAKCHKPSPGNPMSGAVRVGPLLCALRIRSRCSIACCNAPAGIFWNGYARWSWNHLARSRIKSDRSSGVTGCAVTEEA